MLSGIRYYLNSRKQILVISFSRLTDSMGGGAVYFALPLFISEINPSGLPNAFLAGLIIATWGIVATIVQPFFGLWIDRNGKPKFLLFIGLLLTSFVILAYMLVTDLYTLFTVRIALGITEALTLTAGAVVIAALSRRSERGESFGIFYTLTDVGFALSPILAGILLENLGFNEVFISGAVLTLLSAILVFKLVPEVEAKTRREKIEISREIFYISLSLFFSVAALSSIVPLEEGFIEYMHLTPLTFGITYSSYIFTRTLFNTPVGKLSDRIGRKKVFVIGTILIGISTAFIPFCKNFEQIFLLRSLQGVFVALVYSPATALIADKSEKSLGVGMSVTNSSLTLGLATGPIIAGILGGFIGFSAPFYVFGFLIVISGLMAVFKVS
ncbi:MAG: MFS transporter [Archaeoglobus sp.]|nr:MFS transporter [Archaeoglobus sp.]